MHSSLLFAVALVTASAARATREYELSRRRQEEWKRQHDEDYIVIDVEMREVQDVPQLTGGE